MIETINGRDMNLESTEKGKILQSITGIETDGKMFAMNKQGIDDMTKQEVISKFNDKVDEYTKRFDKYNETLEKEAERLSDEFDKLEIKPFG